MSATSIAAIMAPVPTVLLDSLTDLMGAGRDDYANVNCDITF
jgi:hypothetical protein